MSDRPGRCSSVTPWRARSGSAWSVSAGWVGCTASRTTNAATTSRTAQVSPASSSQPTKTPSARGRGRAARVRALDRQLAGGRRRSRGRGRQHRDPQPAAPRRRGGRGPGGQACLGREAGRPLPLRDRCGRGGRRRRRGAVGRRLQLPTCASRATCPRAHRLRRGRRREPLPLAVDRRIRRRPTGRSFLAVSPGRGRARNSRRPRVARRRSRPAPPGPDRERDRPHRHDRPRAPPPIGAGTHFALVDAARAAPSRTRTSHGASSGLRAV